ncbi:MAG: hypothetical protein JOZ54_03045, partial [Acidobacteria bacterium]|nr:hypothetical protein [Acidobacteriota bacterium]
SFAQALREQTEGRAAAEALANASLEQSREFERRYLELLARLPKDQQT